MASGTPVAFPAKLLAMMAQLAKWTEGARSRAPVFLRLRDDVDPASQSLAATLSAVTAAVSSG